MNYYIALETKSHAFLLEQRLKKKGIICELSYMPREIMTDLCAMGLKISDIHMEKAKDALRFSGLPGYIVYLEEDYGDCIKYTPVSI